jgi:hypothetical protein
MGKENYCLPLTTEWKAILLVVDRESMLLGCSFFFDSWKVVAKDEKHEL